MQQNLIENKIYQGFYVFNREEYFSFFKLKDENTAIDIITNKIFELDKFNTIYYDVNDLYIKYIRSVYKNDKNLNVFIKKDYVDVHLNTFFSKILRFFNLKDYTELTSIDIGKEKLNNVILKLKKYTKRYMDQSSIDIYVKHLEKYQTINEVLSILPTELIQKNNPFWAKILQDGSMFIWNYDVPIEAYDLLNYFEFRILDVYKDKEIIENKQKEITDCVENKYKEIINCYTPTCERICDELLISFRTKNKSIFEDKLNNALSTLEIETKQAQESNDNDLLMEIEIIKSELDNIKTEKLKLIDNLEINTNIEEWFPDLLYPIPTDDSIDDIRYIYIEIKNTIDALSKEIYPYFSDKTKNFLKEGKFFNHDIVEKLFKFFLLKRYF